MSTPVPVAKPATAGTGKNAISQTKSAWVNVRSGPGTQYNDIGDLYDNTLVVYYAATRTSTNWAWVEFQGTKGWVSLDYVTFEDVAAIQNPNPTPYDGKVAIWHWKGQAVKERTIEELARNIKSRTPNVRSLFVKTSDATRWQGDFDSGELAITGTDAVDRWVKTLEQNGLEFHAWCVLHGLDTEAEANLINSVCQRPGVKSMILDIEPYAGYWQGGQSAVRQLMVKVRQLVGPAFHIGLSVDPRRQHYSTIFPAEWFPFVNSVHPQTYWRTFGESPDETIADMYSVWGKYGRTIIPVFQGDASVSEQEAAHTLATQKYGAPGLSWWRYGVISQWSAVNTPITLTTSPAEPDKQSDDNYTDEKIIIPGGTGFRTGTYTGKEEFGQFEGRWGWNVFYTSTEQRRSKVWAEWKSDLPVSGVYEIATFVPKRHATTNKARFKIHGIKGTTTEVVVDIDQGRHNNQWVPLGIFELVKGAPNAGKVFLNDVTGEAGKEIAFDAIRWRRIVTTPAPPTTSKPAGPDVINGVYVANGFDSPVGTAEQRSGTQLWPTGWADASPFAQLYFKGTPSEAYHTGADLNWGRGPYDDKGQPVYACASGVIVFAASLSVWGNVIIIRHDPLYSPDGEVIYSRYGHIQEMKVKAGDRVKKGDQIAEVGDAFGRFVPHLHFDLSPTTILERKPEDWPKTNLQYLLKNYVNPKDFIKSHRPK